MKHALDNVVVENIAKRETKEKLKHCLNAVAELKAKHEQELERLRVEMVGRKLEQQEVDNLQGKEADGATEKGQDDHGADQERVAEDQISAPTAGVSGDGTGGRDNVQNTSIESFALDNNEDGAEQDYSDGDDRRLVVQDNNGDENTSDAPPGLSQQSAQQENGSEQREEEDASFFDGFINLQVIDATVRFDTLAYDDDDEADGEFRIGIEYAIITGHDVAFLLGSLQGALNFTTKLPFLWLGDVELTDEAVEVLCSCLQHTTVALFGLTLYTSLPFEQLRRLLQALHTNKSVKRLSIHDVEIENDSEFGTCVTELLQHKTDFTELFFS
jgi:hypothetical protein